MSAPPSAAGPVVPGVPGTADARGPGAAPTASGGSRSPSPRWRRRLRHAATGLMVALLLLLVASVAGLLPVQVMRVGSDSMSPTFGAGDLVLLDRSGGAVARMDVVAVEHPETGILLVKRAVALGGDRVAIEDGVLVVDGAPVCEPAIDPARLDGVWFGPVTVPSGELFLLGDERDSAIDSRHFGTVPTAEVRGLVDGRLWPSPGPLRADRC